MCLFLTLFVEAMLSFTVLLRSYLLLTFVYLFSDLFVIIYFFSGLEHVSDQWFDVISSLSPEFWQPKTPLFVFSELTVKFRVDKMGLPLSCVKKLLGP